MTRIALGGEELKLPCRTLFNSNGSRNATEAANPVSKSRLCCIKERYTWFRVEELTVDESNYEKCAVDNRPFGAGPWAPPHTLICYSC